jgi:hypothetical protein
VGTARQTEEAASTRKTTATEGAAAATITKIISIRHHITTQVLLVTLTPITTLEVMPTIPTINAIAIQVMITRANSNTKRPPTPAPTKQQPPAQAPSKITKALTLTLLRRTHLTIPWTTEPMGQLAVETHSSSLDD